MNNDLTTEQKDYAVFLPSISGFYATFIGKQRYGEYVDPNRVPAGLNTVEGLNFLNPKDALITPIDPTIELLLAIKVSPAHISI